MSIEKKLVIMIFSVWCILAFDLVIVQVYRAINALLPIYSLNLEQKYELIDGNFYNFVKQCEAGVGARESILFKSLPRDPDFRTPNWFLKEYFVGKLSYLLYPRKILRGQDITGEAKYIIIFDTNSRTLKLNYR